jgi:NADH-quinone oxidoreductase subunit N
LNTPLLWILLPGILAAGLLIIQRWERLVVILGTIGALGFAWLAWWLPAKEFFFVGPWYVRVVESWAFLGRRFVLGVDDRPAVMVLYLGTAFWFGAAIAAKTERKFVPLGLGIVATFTAALAVEPFLYAALLIAMAVLLSIPLLVPSGKPVGRGTLRYLTYQTLGVPFILLAGWTLSGFESGGLPLDLPLRASLFMGLGFAFLLAMFPFHSWIPMLAEESNPYISAFLFLVVPGAITFFGLGLLDRFAWLRQSEHVFQTLRTAGILMVLTAGMWAAIERHLGRMLGYAALMEIGLSVVTVGLVQGGQEAGNLGILFAALLPRGLGLGLWALALTVLASQTSTLNFKDVEGIAQKVPLAAASLILAHFSIAGLPLLAGFPPRLALLESLAATSMTAGLWVLVGCVGLMIGGLRTLAVLVSGPEGISWQMEEGLLQRIFLAIGVSLVIVMGIFPQWFLPIFSELPRMFKNLAP